MPVHVLSLACTTLHEPLPDSWKLRMEYEPSPTFYFLHMDILSSIRYNLVESPLRTRWIVATVVILIRSDILRALLIAVLYVLVRHRVHPISQNPHVALRR